MSPQFCKIFDPFWYGQKVKLELVLCFNDGRVSFQILFDSKADVNIPGFVEHLGVKGHRTPARLLLL